MFTQDLQKSDGFYNLHSICILSLQIDKNLPFLNGYVQEAIEKGAQPYIPESERSGTLDISNFRNQDQHEASLHGLRFEAYELPKPSQPTRVPPASHVPTNELVPVPEPSYPRETQRVTTLPSASNSDSSELKLRLDGVQKKWGRPTYSTEASTSSSTSQKSVNGVSKADTAGTVDTKAHDNTPYNQKKPQVEINPEKQKLAASLFGGSAKADKRGSSTLGHKAGKTSNHSTEKSQTSKASVKTSVEKTIVQPPPDLLDLGEPTMASIPPSEDPFKQLEGLLEPNQFSSSANHDAVGSANKAPDLMGLYTDTAGSGLMDDVNALSGITNSANVAASQPSQVSKGPNTKDALEKDALVRQMGVTPTSQNPNLFKDLLG